MVAKILDFIKQVIGALLVFLPNSPFTAFTSAISDIPFLGYLNYFLPIAQIIAVSQAWLTAIGIFYIYQLLLRWVKAIE